MRKTTPDQLRHHAAVLSTLPDCTPAQVQLAMAHILAALADLLERSDKEQQRAGH